MGSPLQDYQRVTHSESVNTNQSSPTSTGLKSDHAYSREPCPDELELWGKAQRFRDLACSSDPPQHFEKIPHVQPDSFSTSTTRLSVSGCVEIACCRGPLLQDVALSLLLVLEYSVLVSYC